MISAKNHLDEDQVPDLQHVGVILVDQVCCIPASNAVIVDLHQTDWSQWQHEQQALDMLTRFPSLARLLLTNWAQTNLDLKHQKRENFLGPAAGYYRCIACAMHRLCS